jgi:uncharacterized membrane protein
MLRLLVILASIANCVGGVVLIAAKAMHYGRLPIIVPFVGGLLLIQGAYTLLYLEGGLDRWGRLATSALFAGESLSVCVGVGGLIEGIAHYFDYAEWEMPPVVAGLLLLVQALLALLYLIVIDRLRARRDVRPG